MVPHTHMKRGYPYRPHDREIPALSDTHRSEILDRLCTDNKAREYIHTILWAIDQKNGYYDLHRVEHPADTGYTPETLTHVMMIFEDCKEKDGEWEMGKRETEPTNGSGYDSRMWMARLRPSSHYYCRNPLFLKDGYPCMSKSASAVTLGAEYMNTLFESGKVVMEGDIWDTGHIHRLIHYAVSAD